MKTAAGEVVHIDTVSDIPCTRISVDGTWQKRGHSSLHGVVTAISGDKCLDVEIKSRHCFGCKMWENKHGTSDFKFGNLTTSAKLIIQNPQVQGNQLVLLTFFPHHY